MWEVLTREPQLHRGWEFEFAGNLYFSKRQHYIIVARYGEYNDELTCEKFYLVRHSCTEDGNSSSRGKFSEVGSLRNCRLLSRKSTHYQIDKKRFSHFSKFSQVSEDILTASALCAYLDGYCSTVQCCSTHPKKKKTKKKFLQLLHCVLDPQNRPGAARSIKLFWWNVQALLMKCGALSVE